MALLRPVAQAIREADPQAQIIGGSGDGPLSDIVRQMMAAGLLDLIDILNLHLYPGSRAPEGYLADMDRLRRDMSRYGKPKPIWITEFSYYGADNLPRKPFLPEPNDWAQNRLLENERQCADYTLRFSLIMLSKGVEKIHIHSGSSGSVNMPSLECCLLDYGGAPRKAAAAMAVLAGLLETAFRPVPSPQPADDVYCAAFETTHGSFVAVWSVVPGKTLRVPSGILGCLDAMGNALRGAAISLSETPVYLLGRKGQAAAIVQKLTVSAAKKPSATKTRRQ